MVMWLAIKFCSFSVSASKGGPIFIPHRLTARLDLNWQRVTDRLGAEVVLPGGESQEVIRRIASAELVIAESMHAAIIADAFRVPWIPVRISHHFNEFKWQDWADSVEATLEYHDALSQLRQVYFMARRAKAALSGKKAAKGPEAQASEGPRAEKAAFKNPNYMQEDEREFVKKAISTFAPVVERVLIRDLKRVMTQRPSLSPDGVQQARQAQMLDRIDQLTRKWR